MEGREGVGRGWSEGKTVPRTGTAAEFTVKSNAQAYPVLYLLNRDHQGYNRARKLHWQYKRTTGAKGNRIGPSDRKQTFPYPKEPPVAALAPQDAAAAILAPHGGAQLNGSYFGVNIHKVVLLLTNFSFNFKTRSTVSTSVCF